MRNFTDIEIKTFFVSCFGEKKQQQNQNKPGRSKLKKFHFYLESMQLVGL